MKKMLMLMLVLLLGVSSAYAGTLDLMISGSGTTLQTISPITPTKSSTVAPSDYLNLDIYYTGTAPLKLASISADITVTGNGTLSGIAVGSLTEPTGAWDTDLRWVTEVVAGKHYILDYSMNNGVAAVTDQAVVALDHILFHCDGAGPVTITMANNLLTNAGDTIETNMARLNFGAPVTITQVPEPATMILLAAGGLFLKRRK